MLPLLAATATKTVIQGIKISHLAVWLGLVILLFVLPALFNPKKFKEAMLEFVNAGNSLMRFTATVDIIVAFLILNTHKGIDFGNPRSIMAAFGWLLLVRGAVRLWFPEFVRERARKMLGTEYGVHVMAFVGLVVAALLGYLGIWVY